MSKEEEYDLIADLEKMLEEDNSVLETVNGITFYKHDKNDKIWWVEDPEDRKDDNFRFSFDQKKIFHVFGDYPKKLSKEQKEIFDKECPFWAEFFNGSK